MSRIQAIYEVRKRIDISEYYALLRLDIGADVALMMDTLDRLDDQGKLRLEATSKYYHAGPADRTARIKAVNYDTQPIPGIGAENAAS